MKNIITMFFCVNFCLISSVNTQNDTSVKNSQEEPVGHKYQLNDREIVLDLTDWRDVLPTSFTNDTFIDN